MSSLLSFGGLRHNNTNHKINNDKSDNINNGIIQLRVQRIHWGGGGKLNIKMFLANITTSLTSVFYVTLLGWGRGLVKRVQSVCL